MYARVDCRTENRRATDVCSPREARENQRTRDDWLHVWLVSGAFPNEIITFWANGKRQFVPRDQVFP